MDLSTVWRAEQIAINAEVSGYTRSFESGILIMTYASLRFTDVQILRAFEVNGDSARGTFPPSKTKKPKGPNWLWGFPRMGIARTADWDKPRIDMRPAYAQIDGRGMSFTFPRLGRIWNLFEAAPAPYSAERRKLALLLLLLLCVGVGDSNGGSYTLRSPWKISPTSATRMSFRHRASPIIGHRPIASKIPDGYRRSVFTSELHMRSTIVHRMANGWDRYRSTTYRLRFQDTCALGRLLNKLRSNPTAYPFKVTTRSTNAPI